MTTTSTIHVCQSSKSCRNKGSEAVLVEIEELAKLIDGDHNHKCVVKKAGCLAHCREGPTVHVGTSTKLEDGSVQRRKPKIHIRIDTLEKSAGLLEEITGHSLDLTKLPAETEKRLSKLKKKLAREYAVSLHQWNKALYGLHEEVQEHESLREELQMILTKAGYSEYAAYNNEWMFQNYMPANIQNYVPWTLQSVEIVSSHSAIFKLKTKDVGRRTPHPRGSSKLASPITWHVTMLGEVGMNEEGPLPWIERDYTPISSALEWEMGRVEILIKVYDTGQLTSWLHQSRMLRKEEETKEPEDDSLTSIWLSKPLKTLSVPNLVPDESDGFKPGSVLLLLAGTGVVALPQILAHRDPDRLLGISTPKRKQLQCPIDLILSFRGDDLLMLEEINNWCIESKTQHPRYRGLRNCTLLITSKSASGNVPFPEYETEEKNDLEKLKENMSIRSQRLNKEMISESLEKMIKPCRVVISGPDSFNQAASELLEECGFATSSHMTILSA